MMVMGWHVLGACVVTIYKRSYDIRYHLMSTLSSPIKKLWDEPDPL